MKPQTYHLDLDAIAEELAAIIDVHAGEHPLVFLRDEVSGADLVWLYAHLVIEVFVDEAQPLSIRTREVGGISIGVKSLQQGMELLRATERLRQRLNEPYIRLR